MQTISVELVAWITAAGSLFGSGWLACMRIVVLPLSKRLDAVEAKQEAINSTLIERLLSEPSAH